VPLLVDCYNVLHTEKPPLLAGLTTARLCRALATSRWAGEPIVVVCDGRPAPTEITRSPVAGVQLVYSGAERIADAVIADHIAQHTAPRRLLVVSSDHEIQQAARRRRSGHLSSETFLHYLAQSPREAASAVAGGDKPSPTEQSRAEIDAWLQSFGYRASPSIDPPPQASDFRPEDDPDVPWPPPDVERR